MCSILCFRGLSAIETYYSRATDLRVVLLPKLAVMDIDEIWYILLRDSLEVWDISEIE